MQESNSTGTDNILAMQWHTDTVVSWTITKRKGFFFLVGWDLRHQVLRPILAYCTAPNDRWGWLWSNWWNEDWQGKPKYSEKTCPSATLSTTNPTWPYPCSNTGRRGGKPATNRLSDGAATRPPLVGFGNVLAGAFRGESLSEHEADHPRSCSNYRSKNWYLIPRPSYAFVHGAPI
jgi:hypothetical protein